MAVSVVDGEWANPSPLSDAQGPHTLTDGGAIQARSQGRDGTGGTERISLIIPMTSRTRRRNRRRKEEAIQRRPMLIRQRSEGAFYAPSCQRARANSHNGKAAGGAVCRACHRIVMWDRAGNFAATQDDFDHALRSPAMGRPAYDVLHVQDGPGPHPGHMFLAEENFRNSTCMHSCIRQQGVGPMSPAVGIAGATSAPEHEFRKMDTHGVLERSSPSSNLEGR